MEVRRNGRDARQEAAPGPPTPQAMRRAKPDRVRDAASRAGPSTDYRRASNGVDHSPAPSQTVDGCPQAAPDGVGPLSDAEVTTTGLVISALFRSMAAAA